MCKQWFGEARGYQRAKLRRCDVLISSGTKGSVFHFFLIMNQEDKWFEQASNYLTEHDIRLPDNKKLHVMSLLWIHIIL